MRRVMLAVVVALFSYAQKSEATTITFTATDLVDTTPGDDLWQYQYLVSDFVFAADQGFIIKFSPTFYKDLQDPPPAVNADWDPLTTQPDPGLPADGHYDALALIASPSLANPFKVNFVWLGGPAKPGVQPFVLYELDVQGAPVAFADGRTTPESTGATPVPEPTTIGLLGSGAFAFVTRAVRRRRERRFAR